MIRKILLSIFALFTLSGCSLDSLIALTKVDRVQKIKHTSSMKHYRAYFKRDQLRSIKRGKKYLYFYNAKKKDFAILLRRKNQYILYSIYHAHNVIARINGTKKTRYYHIARMLRKKGYRPTSPASVGSTASMRFRRYQGIKTLRMDVRDYRALQSKYKRAIRNYNSSTLRRVKTYLPKHLILAYYNRYKRLAKTPHQKRELMLIGKKLRFATMQSESKEVLDDETSSTRKKTNNYQYYLTHASYGKLKAYLSQGSTKSQLTDAQYRTLKRREAFLKDENTLRNGSLEKLIVAYKHNRNPRFKRRIMQLMKEEQKKK